MENIETTSRIKEVTIMLSWVKQQMKYIKSLDIEPNTPFQISKGGKHKAFNDMKVKLESRLLKLKTQ